VGGEHAAELVGGLQGGNDAEGGERESTEHGNPAAAVIAQANPHAVGAADRGDRGDRDQRLRELTAEHEAAGMADDARRRAEREP
jgi:hypothetical protein